MRPNLLLVLADQHRACDLGCAGNALVRTPNLDACAAAGWRSARCISGSPVCVPARGSLLTGLHPWRHRALANDLPIDTALPSIATAAAAAGYRTGYIGKWHLGGVPRDRAIGADERLGFAFWRAANCNHDYWHGWCDDEAARRIRFTGHETEAQADLACAFIADRSDPRPWLLVVSWGPPHDPYEMVPPALLARLPEDLPLRGNVGGSALHRLDRPPWERPDLVRCTRGYYALIDLVDGAFGRLLAALAASGQADDTLVAYTSDHGDMLGSHGCTNKQLPWAESVNVPLILRGPGVRPGASGEPIALVDLPVSLLAHLGLALPGRPDGADRSALWRRAQARGAAAVPIWDLVPAHQAAARGGRPWAGLVTRDRTYAQTLDDGADWLCYDDDRDPLQLRNLVGDPARAAEVAALAAATRAFVAEQGLAGPWPALLDRLGLVEAWNRSQRHFTLPELDRTAAAGTAAPHGDPP